MKINKLKLIITAVITSTLIANTTLIDAKAAIDTQNFVTNEVSNSKESSVQFITDSDNSKKLPKNFRTTKDDVSSKNTENIDLTGLSDLNMSGSGALSENSLKLIKKKTKGYKLVDVDLRQESHGFINGLGVSWYGDRDDANINLSEKEVIKDEYDKFDAIKDAGYAKFDYNPKKSACDLREINDIKSAEPESDLADSLDIRYLRIQVPDHYKPSYRAVDEFVEGVKKLSKKKNTWFHFHCRGGVGRTTTFMCMYDMMNNAKKVSFQDILKRQALIGGSDLLEGNEEDKQDPANSRAAFLQKFYNYCVDNDDNFKTSFSEYMENK